MCNVHERDHTIMLTTITAPIASALTIAMGVGFLTVAGMITKPQPQDNLQAYQACKALHPQRYCRLTHLPSEQN